MPQVDNQDARDKVLWDAWVAGTRQADLAEAHGISQPAVSQAINRYRATIPIEDKATAFVRDLERLEELIQVYRPLALAGDLDAAKLIKGLVAQEAKMLGLEAPRTIEAIVALAPSTIGAELSDRLATVRHRNTARLAAIPGTNGHGHYAHEQTKGA